MGHGIPRHRVMEIIGLVKFISLGQWHPCQSLPMGKEISLFGFLEQYITSLSDFPSPMLITVVILLWRTGSRWRLIK